ncbi:MAG: Ldh family oxidoreductase [Pyrinomonadaceae bacterium]|nr:Ldh family oxidoreductase [Sphingobacteriaceae bacterium]
MPSESNIQYKPTSLINFACSILSAAGLSSDRSKIVAEVLVEADLMGHTTHGLKLLTTYANELESGGMCSIGDPEVINDQGSAITWNGNYLPGPWLVQKALDLALERIENHPVVTIVIQKSHHIACLAAYLERVTYLGYFILLSCSDPKNKTVAPFGGTKGVYSPNPIAAGIPTRSQPILLDVSMSATSNASVKRAFDAAESLQHPWLLTRDGEVTDDPGTFYANNPSTILPLGNLDTGYKGYAMGLMVEALTNALCGYGRKDEPNKWMASVFIQLINPQSFAGINDFKNETQHLVDSCTNPENTDVRMPGGKALKLKAEQKVNGLMLSPEIIASLKQLSLRYSILFSDQASN